MSSALTLDPCTLQFVSQDAAVMGTSAALSLPCTAQPCLVVPCTTRLLLPVPPQMQFTAGHYICLLHCLHSCFTFAMASPNSRSSTSRLLLCLSLSVVHLKQLCLSAYHLRQLCLSAVCLRQLCLSAALATEDPSPDLLLETPHGRTEPLINPAMWTHITVQGLYQVILCSLLFSAPLVSRFVVPMLTSIHCMQITCRICADYMLTMCCMHNLQGAFDNGKKT